MPPSAVGSTAATGKRGLDRKAVLARFASNLPRHIVEVARVLNARLVSGCEERGYDKLRPSFLHMLFQLDAEGRRLVDVVGYSGLSQQAAGQIGGELEQLGYVKRLPDHHDGRAKRLLLTPAGEKLALCAEQVSRNIERSLLKLTGADRLGEFKRSCTELFASLVSPASAQIRHHNPAGSLPLSLAGLATYVERRLLEMDKARGYRDLKISFAQVLTYTSPDGTLLNDLASVNDVSKQAISKVVKEVERLGYVGRKKHPVDGRSTIIFLTDAGLRLIQDSLDNIGKIEAEFASALGRRGAKHFAANAQALFEQLVTGAPGTENHRGNLSAEALLRLAAERLYQESSGTARTRMFNCAGHRAKLSAAALQLLGSIEIHISD